MYISLANAREIFGNKDSTTEEIEEVLIVYKLNKPAFLNMIASVNLQDGKFTIDLSKINAFKENEGGQGSSRLQIEHSFEDGSGNNEFKEDFSAIHQSMTSKFDEYSQFISEKEDAASQNFITAEIGNHAPNQSVMTKKSANASKISVE